MTTSPRNLIEEHAHAIWHTTELPRNQQAEDGETISISRGALQHSCQQIDKKLSTLLEEVDKLQTSNGSI